MPSTVDSALGSEQQSQARRKRKLTEARRQQNRRSQQIWREKQKQRRDQEIKLRVQQELEKREKEGTTVPSTSEPAQSSGASGQSRESISDTHLNSLSAAANFGNVDDVNVTIPEPVLPLKVAVYYYVPPVPGAQDYRHSWPVPDDVEFKTYTLPPGVKPDAGALSTLSPSASSSAQLSPVSLYYRHRSESRSRVSGRSPQGSLPSPLVNHLQLVGESCFAATMSIAQCLGISMQSYINDHPSPFTTASNANVHIIPVDLRPTAYQLILPHPAYLDCIPFPHFRSMAIYLSSMKRLDHCSLFLDLMHDGMVCWGRERASVQYGRSMRDGVAWNRRSWEVRGWFWRKWSWIARMTVEGIDAGLDPAVDLQPAEEDFDDEDGMLSGSQWWWSLHGDEDPTESLSTVPTQEQEAEEFGSLLSRVVTCNVGVRKPEESHLLVKWD
ncbi:hypothetical protein H2200_001025 [Cladophialophora chaetospira]|uniref:BZIP domain-containing protein n=1 Tax=Cladophialophora chaetospira TaxID=386627 RepID=A0AA39CPQ2_9EURO|nr:hypothetical protein H2200_001025 [Cladophialophora chaetospira]